MSGSSSRRLALRTRRGCASIPEHAASCPGSRSRGAMPSSPLIWRPSARRASRALRRLAWALAVPPPAARRFGCTPRCRPARCTRRAREGDHDEVRSRPGVRPRRVAAQQARRALVRGCGHFFGPATPPVPGSSGTASGSSSPAPPSAKLPARGLEAGVGELCVRARPYRPGSQPSVEAVEDGREVDLAVRQPELRDVCEPQLVGRGRMEVAADQVLRRVGDLALVGAVCPAFFFA